ncbi:DUF4355 domain-containing protein [Paenibacillus woosongensis]|uniref:Phage scaffold protein n=1 Tax=Paenibacillus woosongensis TaxID=307580 RepID=A0ABQ4MPI7_9BACL|nr:DUF4355 domain-containing protein [Paenibacillus woosongensis]GIP57905.1 phage scaffold protein [Paenibacillus woosongensis]
MKDFVESKFRIPLNLQLFGDDEDSNDDADKGDDDKDEGKKKDDEITFTPEQQARIDALIAKTIAKERSKAEADVEKAKTEAEKLAKMNADQKAEYERQQREAKLAEREAEITKRELRASALETLAEKGLPKGLADILNYTDADSTKESLEAVETAFRAAVEAGVNERLKGNPPGGGGGNRGAGQVNPWKKETFNLTEQGRILRDNPELAKQLKAAAK